MKFFLLVNSTRIRMPWKHLIRQAKPRRQFTVSKHNETFDKTAQGCNGSYGDYRKVLESSFSSSHQSCYIIRLQISDLEGNISLIQWYLEVLYRFITLLFVYVRTLEHSNLRVKREMYCFCVPQFLCSICKCTSKFQNFPTVHAMARQYCCFQHL